MIRMTVASRRWCAGTLVLLNHSALAQEATTALGSAPSTFTTLLQVVLALALVMAAIAVAAFAMRRYMPAARGVGGFMKVIGGVMVGPKERVVVVELGDTWLVLGVTNTQVNMLHSIPKPAGGAAELVKPGDEHAFSAWLGKAIKRNSV